MCVWMLAGLIPKVHFGMNYTGGFMGIKKYFGEDISVPYTIPFSIM